MAFIEFKNVRKEYTGEVKVYNISSNDVKAKMFFAHSTLKYITIDNHINNNSMIKIAFFISFFPLT